MNLNRSNERRYDIDWLRNIGILLLFPFHSARVFDVWDPFYVKSETLSWGLSWFISLTSYWFMPLLFWLAGSASWYALQHRSGKQYIKERVMRLFIPFIVGLLLIVPPQGYFAKLYHTGEVGSYFSFLKTFFTDFSDLSGYFGTFTPAHLWFILYLFVLSIIALPLFQFLKKDQNKAKLHSLSTILSRPIVFILLFIPLTITQALPDPGGQNPFFYLFILVLGYIVCTSPSYQEMINRIRFKAFLSLLILVPIWLILMVQYRDAADFSSISILIAFLRMLNVLLTLIVLIGYGNKYLNRKHKWLAYMNEAAFPVYILHQTILVVIGYYVIRLEMGIIPGFILIMILTFICSVLIYELMIKRIPIISWLFGVKVKK
jgi:glucan biosynthesis protein C